MRRWSEACQSKPTSRRASRCFPPMSDPHQMEQVAIKEKTAFHFTSSHVFSFIYVLRILVFYVLIRARRLLGFGSWGLKLSGVAGASAKWTETQSENATKDLQYPTGDHAGHRGRGKTSQGVKHFHKINENSIII